MRRGENPTVVLDALRERIIKVSATLPAGVKIKPFYDRTELVNTTLKTVFENLAFALRTVAVTVPEEKVAAIRGLLDRARGLGAERVATGQYL